MLLSPGTLAQGEETCSKKGPFGDETLGRGFCSQNSTGLKASCDGGPPNPPALGTSRVLMVTLTHLPDQRDRCWGSPGDKKPLSPRAAWRGPRLGPSIRGQMPSLQALELAWSAEQVGAGTPGHPHSPRDTPGPARGASVPAGRAATRARNEHHSSRKPSGHLPPPDWCPRWYRPWRQVPTAGQPLLVSGG